MSSSDYSCEIHITFLDLEIKDDDTGEEAIEKWAHVAYFHADVKDEKRRRQLVDIGQDEYEQFCTAFNSSIDNGERIVVYYNDKNQANTRLDLYNPYGEIMVTIGKDDALFVFGTRSFNGKFD